MNPVESSNNMFQTKTKKENIAHRLKIVRGHLQKVIQMVKDDSECMDISFQIRAIQQAVKKIDCMVVENAFENMTPEEKHAVLFDVVRTWKRAHNTTQRYL